MSCNDSSTMQAILDSQEREFDRCRGEEAFRKGSIPVQFHIEEVLDRLSDQPPPQPMSLDAVSKAAFPQSLPAFGIELGSFWLG